MKKVFALIALCLIFTVINAQDKKIWDETELEQKERLAWWTDARFGMFIHWGLYAIPAEDAWFKTHKRQTNEEYKKYFDIFDPDLYDPKDWARQAKAAGMKYAVITTKHHDGFCLFDSEYTDYDASSTPYGKDMIKEWVDAFRAEGLKIGFYYSLLDWHHPDYTVDLFHPLRPESSPELNAEFWGPRNHVTSPETDKEFERINKGRDMSKYREYLKNQVTELLSNYGEVSILWLDYSYKHKHGKNRDDWGSVELFKHIRKLQPGIIINDRADMHDYAGGWDFRSPEQAKLTEWPTEKGKKVYWETCQTFSGSWGYHREEDTWKDNKQLLILLISSVSKGGNLLLNVGPTGRGTFDYRAENALNQMGDWMKFNSRSIYGCTQAPPDRFEVPDNSLLTYNPTTNRLYIHLLDYPLKFLRLEGMKGKIVHAQFLHDASEIVVEAPTGHWAQSEQGDVNLVMPVKKPPFEIPVIEIMLK